MRDSKLISFMLLNLLAVSAVTHVARAESQQSPDEETHPGLMAEVEYAEATFAFENKNYSEALRILDALTRRHPKHVEALELEALTLKTLGKEAQSIGVYEQLIKLKPDKEAGPYYFELGSAYMRAKDNAKARTNLQGAISHGFNVGISHFLIGTLELQSKESLSAERHFDQALSDLPADLKVATHLYTGLAMSQRGNGGGATRELFAAREDAKDLPNSPIAQDSGKVAAKALEPMDHASWFGNVSLTSQFDGNVSTISDSVAAQDSSGKETFKALVSGSVGWISSSLRRVQVMINYRFAGNYNFNDQAAIYDFATNTLSGTLTVNPVARFSFGVKAEGNYAFQNMQDAVTGSKAFSPYSLNGDFGPFVRMELTEQIQMSTDFSVKPGHYYTDAPPDNLRRSGTIYFPHVSLRYVGGSSYLNPELSAGYEINQSQGTDFRSNTLSLSLSNSFRLPGKNVLTASADLTLANYSQRVPSRSDTTVGGHLTWVRELTPKLSLIADASYMSNSSNQPVLFSYTKPTLSLGVSYVF